MAPDIQIVKQLKEQLKIALGDFIQDVILFGSRSSGEANDFSDFDILIVASQKPTILQKRMISEICYDIELLNDILIDSHLLTDLDLHSLRGKQPIFQKAIRKGIYA